MVVRRPTAGGREQHEEKRNNCIVGPTTFSPRLSRSSLGWPTEVGQPRLDRDNLGENVPTIFNQESKKPISVLREYRNTIRILLYSRSTKWSRWTPKRTNTTLLLRAGFENYYQLGNFGENVYVPLFHTPAPGMRRRGNGSPVPSWGQRKKANDPTTSGAGTATSGPSRARKTSNILRVLLPAKYCWDPQMLCTDYSIKRDQTRLPADAATTWKFLLQRVSAAGGKSSLTNLSTPQIQEYHKSAPVFAEYGLESFAITTQTM